jgi:peroxiredoxin
MIAIGDKIPETKLRTDEGTPLALTDLKGRAFVLFVLGPSFTPTVERLLDELSKNVSRFLSLDVSPIALVGDTVENLADYRDHYDTPFLLISDEDLTLHSQLRGDDESLATAWIVDKEGTVVDIVPFLPPSELIAMTRERVTRSIFAGGRKG